MSPLPTPTPTAALTTAQYRVFVWVEDYINQHGIAPTYREIQKGLGYRSPSPIKNHISALVAKGFISHLEGRSRAIVILKPNRSVPVLGAIAAHSLVETFPDTEIEYLGLSCLPKLARLSQYELSQHFALRVQGDSMVGALIDDGDLVILRKESDLRAVRNGKIVAARVQGSTTLKYLYRTGNEITLQPANPKYEATILNARTSDLEIQGIYVGLLRGLT
ncbi:MAG: transcriptional repressor LexA [Leptolyngbyaceae cyanobacterium]